MYKRIAVLILAFGAAGAATAGEDSQPGWLHPPPPPPHWGPPPAPPPTSLRAPEIDPAGAISGLTLLLGGLAVVRGRREKK